MLDLGALDSYELLKKGGKKLIFLTEDTKVARLCVLLKATGLEEHDYLIQPLHGVNNLSAAVPIADFFTMQGVDTHVVVHRDGDCMTTDEKVWWAETEGKKLPERTYLFVTPFSDIEHAFCQPAHISAVYGISQNDAQVLINQILAANNASFLIEFTQKRMNLKATALRNKEGAASAEDLVNSQIVFDQVRGKSLSQKYWTNFRNKGTTRCASQLRPPMR